MTQARAVHAVRAAGLFAGLFALLVGLSGGPALQAQTTGNPTPTVPPWSVKLVPRGVPLRVGQCTPVSVDLLDASGKDAPRGPDGWRISIADFDMSVTAPPPKDSQSVAPARPGEPATTARLVAGQYHGANSWSACVCQGAPAGTVATITATYPARSLAAKSRVRGVAFESSIALPVAALPPLGPSNPPECVVPVAPTTTTTTITATTVRQTPGE